MHLNFYFNLSGSYFKLFTIIYVEIKKKWVFSIIKNAGKHFIYLFLNFMETEGTKYFPFQKLPFLGFM